MVLFVFGNIILGTWGTLWITKLRYNCAAVQTRPRSRTHGDFGRPINIGNDALVTHVQLIMLTCHLHAFLLISTY